MNRKISVLLVSVSVLGLFSCKKSVTASLSDISGNGYGGTVIENGTTIKLNGYSTAISLQTGMLTVENTDATFLQLQGSDSTFNDISVQLNDNAAIKVGTYTGSKTMLSLNLKGVKYSSYGANTDTIVVSSLSSTSVTGTFKGKVYPDGSGKAINSPITGTFSGKF